MWKSGTSFAVMAALLGGIASAQPARALSTGHAGELIGVIDSPGIAHKAHYVWGGRGYCWHGNGWNGSGWYRCGYAARNGQGWGGPQGWHGWNWSPNGAHHWGHHGMGPHHHGGRGCCW